MMRITIQIYKDKKGKFRWRVKAGNGHIVAYGSKRGYIRKEKCKKMFTELWLRTYILEVLWDDLT